MAYVEWTNSLSVGMADIDVQHQHFISLLNKTKEAVDKGAQKEALRGILNDLVGYARYHFETEEEYFAKYSYPYANEHKAEHAKLLSDTLVFFNRFENGEDIAKEFLSFLKKWLADHLKKHDMKYSKYFKKMGYI